MAMTHERLAVSSGLHTILTNYRVSGSPNVQNPQPTTSLLVYILVVRSHGGRLPDTIFPQNISSLHSIIFPQNHINIFLNILCQATYPHGIS